MFPIEFLAHVDGFLAYLKPLEVPLEFACGWLAYSALGALAGLAIAMPAGLLARLFRRPARDWVTNASACIALWLAFLSILEAAGLWMNAIGWSDAILWMSRQRRWVYFAVATVPALAAWMWWDPELKRTLSRFLCYSSFTALSVTVVSPAALLFLPPTKLPDVPTPSSAAAGGPHPDILLITFDAFAANHASLYGYARQTTPNLEALASQAVVFDRYYANSNFTTATVASLILGARPWTHRALQLEARPDPALAARGLIARLKSSGYQTMTVSTNDWAAPFHNGSDRWVDASITGRTHYVCSHFGTDLIARSYYLRPLIWMPTIQRACTFADHLMVATGIWPTANHYDPEYAFGAARALIAQRDSGRPMFLWVHLYPPHEPYATPKPFVGRFDPSALRRGRFDSEPPLNFDAGLDNEFPQAYVGRYDESILYGDHHLGIFLDWLRQRSIFDKALIVVSADHGESFSHGYGSHRGVALHDDLIRVPLVIKLPREVKGVRTRALAEEIDLMPTLLDLAGIPVTDPVEGRSLRAATFGEEMDGTVFSMNFEQNDRFGSLQTGSVAMISGPWKYVRYLGTTHYPHMPALQDCLFDLSRDPGEQSNLAAVESDIAARMRGAIEDQLRIHGRPLE